MRAARRLVLLGRSVLVAVSLLGFVGCNAVYSTKPVGEKVVSISAEDWDGTWIDSELSTPVTIEVMDAQKGLLKAAWIEKMALESCEVQLLESGEWMFGNLKDKDRPNLFVWGRIKKDHSQIILWFPEVSKIRELVEAGKLPGSVDKEGDVTLGDLTAEHLARITSKDSPLFEWDEPVILVRLSH